MGSSSPSAPSPPPVPNLSAAKTSKKALKGLAKAFGLPGSFFTKGKTIFGPEGELLQAGGLLKAQMAFDALSGLQLQSQVDITQQAEESLLSDEGILGTIFREGLEGPGLTSAETDFLAGQISAQQARRGIARSPVGASEAGLLIGLAGMDRQQQRRGQALQLLGARAGFQQFNTPPSFGQQQAAALQGAGIETQLQASIFSSQAQMFGSQLQSAGQGLAGLGQFAGTAGLLATMGGGGAAAGGAGLLGAAAPLAFFCWVAEELWGPDDSKTHQARAYASTADTWFTRLYQRRGRVWAAWLKTHPWAKPLVEPIWLWMAAKGQELTHGTA